MAEYAGLEIRIGGNTTKLNNALKASTKSAAELQSRIRQITKAMQFDPTDLKNVETRIKLTGDRMQSLQSRAQLTKTAMEQLGNTMTKVLDKDGNRMSVRKIASETENLSLAAKQADERFNNMTGTLAKIYEAWNKLSRSKGADFLKGEMGGFTQAEADRLMSSTTSMREFVSQLKAAQEIRNNPLYDGPGGLITDEMIERAKQFKELNFHDMFKRGLDLDDVIREAEQLGVVIEDSAIANVRELQKTFKEAQAEKDAFDKALKFEQKGTDLQRLDSEAESLSQTMRKLDDLLTPTTMSDEFQAIESQIRQVDSALDNVNRDLERTGDALKADPGNIQLAARYYSDLQQKVALSEEKAELLNQQMGMLDASGASEAAKDHQDLAKWVEDSAEAARVAKKELSDQQATVANLTDQTKGLEQAIDTIKGDSTIAEYSDNVLQWKKRTEQLSDAMKKLETAEKNVATQQQELGKAQASFDKAQSGADELKGKLEDLRAEYRQLSEWYGENNFPNNPNTTYDELVTAYNRLNELESEIKQVETAYNGAQQEVREFSSELSDQQTRADTAEDSLRQAREAVDDLQQSVDELAKTPEVRLFQNPDDELEKMEGELKEMRGELGRAIVDEKRLASTYKARETENELAKTARAMQKVSQEANDTKTDIKRLQEELKGQGGGIFNASTIKSIGMTLSAVVTPAVTALGYKMVDAGSSVDSAYRDMRKTVEGTEEQFEHLRQAAIDFSRTHVTSADQILQIEAIGGELGIATENLETFAEVISNIDVATNLDTESAADTLGHLSNILHLTEDDYVGFSDALVRLGNNGASTETEIANIAERIGSMGAIVGMSGSDILAWSSTIASTGQNAEAAGTAISKTMSFMETAVAAAGGTMDTSFEAISAAVEEGGDKLTLFASLSGRTVEEFTQEWEEAPKDMASTIHDQVEAAKGNLQMIADVAHMSADDFAKAWEEDPTEVLKAFIGGLNDMESAGGSADKVLVDLGIKAVRQKQAIEGLMQTVGGLDDNLKMSEDAWNGVSDQWGKAGDAANEAQKKAEGFSGQLQIMKNIGQSVLAELSEGAVPWIKRFTSILQSASDTLSGMSDETKEFVVTVGGIAALAGPVLSFVGTARTAKEEFFDWFDEATKSMSFLQLSARLGTDTLEKAMSGTMTTMEKAGVVAKNFGLSLLKGLAVAAVAGGIALIAFELKKLYDRYQDHKAATEGLSSALAGVGQASEVAAAKFDSSGRSLSDLVADSREYESRLANLAQTIEDSNRQYGTYAGTLDYYASAIEELGGKTNLTEDEAYKLQAALQAVNDECGTTYGLDNYGNIIDTQTGKIQENTDVIKANIEAKRAQALMEYYSDDYAQAVGEYTDAQEAYNDAYAEWDSLANGDGREKIFNDLKKIKGESFDAAEAQATYEYQLGLAEESMRNYETEVNKTGDALRTLEGKMGAAQEQMDAANQTLADAAAAEEEYGRRIETVEGDVTGNMKKLSDAVTKAGSDDAGFNAISESLEAISVSAKEMDDVDMGKLVSAFSDAGSSMSDVIATLEEGGVQMSTWNSALEQAPGAAENMGNVTSAAFQSMYDSAGGNINDTMTLIAGLETAIGDVDGEEVTFYIGDNGSITDSQGRVYDIKNDLATIPDEVITAYYVDDKDARRKTLEAKRDLTDVNRQKVRPTIGVKDNATKAVKGAKSLMSDLDKATANPTASLNDYASSKIGSIKRDLTDLDGKKATVTIYQNTVKSTKGGGKQATGGMNSVPVIPEHATGYIATGPTLTNQGWIGEDGIEAVANWATGGAVVPLTNRRYMLPIADAIADGMSRRMGAAQAAPQVTITVTGVSSPDEVADAIARKLALLGL